MTTKLASIQLDFRYWDFPELKNIDADKLLKTFVQARRDMHYNHYVKTGACCIAEYKYDEDVELLNLIDSLQQEQPSLLDNLDEAAHNKQLRDGQVHQTTKE